MLSPLLVLNSKWISHSSTMKLYWCNWRRQQNTTSKVNVLLSWKKKRVSTPQPTPAARLNQRFKTSRRHSRKRLSSTTKNNRISYPSTTCSSLKRKNDCQMSPLTQLLKDYTASSNIVLRKLKRTATNASVWWTRRKVNTASSNRKFTRQKTNQWGQPKNWSGIWMSTVP